MQICGCLLHMENSEILAALQTIPNHSTDFVKLEKAFVEFHPKVIYEIGAFCGYGTLMLAYLAKLHGFETTIHTFDIFEAEGKLSRLSAANEIQRVHSGLTYEQVFDNNLARFPELASSIIKHKGLSFLEGGKLKEEIDFVFIDGDHSYAGVMMDIKTFVPKVKIGGIVAFHDYNDKDWYAITEAIDDGVKNVPGFREVYEWQDGDVVIVFMKEK